MKLKLLIGLALLGSLGAAAHAQSLPEAQSRCANDAAAFFAKQKGEDALADSVDYENHYSESMKSCFIIVINHEPIITGFSLFDVYDHRLLGVLRESFNNVVTICYVGDVACKDAAEWQAKVQPYVPGWRR
jgi:hypothetical protein